MNKLILEFDQIPPSTNHIYFNLPTGGRALTKEAKQYKSYIKDKLARECLEDLIDFKFKPNTKFWVYATIYFERLVPKSSSAKEAYLRIDVDNRIKLVQDSVFESLGINDANIFRVSYGKDEGKEKVVMEIEIR
jgi:Holliday junction resolvase RusA-like endonuclease